MPTEERVRIAIGRLSEEIDRIRERRDVNRPRGLAITTTSLGVGVGLILLSMGPLFGWSWPDVWRWMMASVVGAPALAAVFVWAGHRISAPGREPPVAEGEPDDVESALARLRMRYEHHFGPLERRVTSTGMVGWAAITLGGIMILMGAWEAVTQDGWMVFFLGSLGMGVFFGGSGAGVLASGGSTDLAGLRAGVQDATAAVEGLRAADGARGAEVAARIQLHNQLDRLDADRSAAWKGVGFNALLLVFWRVWFLSDGSYGAWLAVTAFLAAMSAKDVRELVAHRPRRGQLRNRLDSLDPPPTLLSHRE